MYAISCYYLFTFFLRSLCRTIVWWTPESPQKMSSPAAAYPSFLWQNPLIWKGRATVQRGWKDLRHQRQTEQTKGSLAPRSGGWGLSRESRNPGFHPFSYCWLSKENIWTDWGEMMALREFSSQYASALVPTLWVFSATRIFALLSVAMCKLVSVMTSPELLCKQLSQHT